MKFLRFASVLSFLLASTSLVADFEPYSPSSLRAAVAFSTYNPRSDLDTGISEANLPRDFGPDAMIRLSRRDDRNFLVFSTAMSSMKWNIPEKIGGLGEIQTVASADLNSDRRPDLVLVMNSTGNGLGGAYSHVIVLLSSDSVYRVSYFSSLFFDLSKFEILDGQRVGVLQGTLIGGGVGKDGRKHNYIVHRRLLIEETALVVDEKFEPKWIMYSFRPNHTETDQVSVERKRELSLKHSWDFVFLGEPN